MKKAFVLLALSLAMLPSLAANQWLYITGYRIGNSDITSNDGRIVATNANDEVKYDSIAVTDNRLSSNAYFNVSVPAGQEVKKWLAYDCDPTIRTPTLTKEFAGAVTEYVWGYNADDTSTKYIVVDYDYITYTLKYNRNGGSGSMSSQEDIYYLNSFNLAPNQFSKTGYSFDGWTNNIAEFGDMALVNGASLGVTYTSKTANLYAKWTPNTYTVTLDPRGGTVDQGSVSVTYDATYGYLPEPTLDGYHFVGWFTSAPGGVQVTAETKVLIIAAQTLYAHWTANNYTVSFNANGGTGSMSNQSFVYDEAKNLTSNSFVKTGYSFGGWATAPASTCEYGDGQSVKNLTTATDGTVTLYAVWTPITYTISFDGNGADSGSVTNIPATYGVECQLPDNGFERAGRSFKTWRLGLDGDTYEAGDSISNLTTTDGATVIFYAIWTEPRYIAFHGNGADNADAMADDMMMFDGIETKPLVPNEFEKTGYTFVGWATNETDAAALKCAYTNCEDVISTNLWMDVCETNDFYAVWQTNKYTVIFNANGGWGAMDNQVFVYDQPQYLPSRDTKITSNLDFQGWATNSTGDVVFREVVDPVSNLTAVADGAIMLYAVWDNGALSKAMDCDNLKWIDSGDTQAPWEVADVGYDGSDSSVSCQVSSSKTQSRLLTPSISDSSYPAGRLSFMYKTSSDTGCILRFNNGTVVTSVGPTNDWTQYGPVDIEDISQVTIQLWRNSGTQTIWIDQMKWEPEGIEPSVLTNDVPSAVTGLVYDGKAKTGVIAGYGHTVGYTISGNVATNAGDYVATATPDAYCVWPDGSSDPTNIQWSVAKAEYDMHGVSFIDATFVVDGEAHSIYVSGDLPDGVAVSYSGNDATTPGTYIVTASFTGDAINYEPIADMTATMTIEKRTIPVPIAVTGLVYNGAEQTGVTNGVDYVLSGNVATNAGEYVATATLGIYCAWPDGSSDPTNIHWSIAKAIYDMSGVTFTNATYAADGEAHSIYVSGDLPDGVGVSYFGNDKTEPGEYEVTATFTGDAENYEPIADWTVKLTIVKNPDPGSYDPPAPGPDDPTPVTTDLVLHPAGEPSLDAFTAEKAETYVGWLRDGSGNIAAQLTVKTSAAKSGKASKSTITVTPVGGKKYTLKTTVQPGGNPTDEFGITYGALGLAGMFEGFSVEASADVAKSKDASVKTLAGKIPVGTYTFVAETGDGTAVFSATVDKKGKTKVQGFLGNGTKVSVSATGSLGDMYFAVPVVVSKSKVSFGFVLWIPLDGGSPVFVGAIGTSWQPLRMGGAIALSNGVHAFDFEVPTFRNYLTTVDGKPVTPGGEEFAVSGAKWISAKTSGKLKVVNGVLSVVANGEPSNLSGLKLTYTAKTGLVKGSFKLYYMDGGKIKSDKVTIVGAVAEGVFMGNGTVKKLGSFAVWAE